MRIVKCMRQTLQLLCVIPVWLLLSSQSAHSNGYEISREQAIAIGKHALHEAQLDVTRYDVFVDEGNKGWQTQMSFLKEDSSTRAQEEYGKYRSALEGHEFWTVFYVGKSADGRYAKDDRVTVIVDRGNGVVLLFIP